MSARAAFVAAAGGPLESARSYRRWSARDKYEGFWRFYDERRPGALSVYAGIAVEALRRESVYSIEHLIPRAFLEQALAHRAPPLRRGATVNPYNFAPCHRRLNHKRGHWPFDLDDDAIVRRPGLPRSGLEDVFGFDADQEWVVPPRSRGDVARGILAVALTYAIGGFGAEALSVYRRWAREDPPTAIERDFDAWVEETRQIRNPLLRDERWLEDEALFAELAALPPLGGPE